ncbi:unnamed protein product [Didymodactylos carnosus]|uniref:G-protein coupled receptors family 1 profile domain-containing protein n=1 Tax=Didymodactylos carnosus TaxID=1234261 RepID=A0A814LL61_9BILA|nr:unnamed protein product [Didymodactylos carnosus]CAF1272574.1 unnamed protein product [Didymodactylos carnosus]CAF3833814.1 unnamed protein product [Didymodactylos carnosus]CAF4077945.1 unnamed protein product [Didymodactylos carnosus]
MYLLAASVSDFIHMNCGPLSNLIEVGFNYSIETLLFCKLKTYVNYVIIAIAATFVTLASMDRYILSTKDVDVWIYSTRKMAKRIITITIIFWSILSIPVLNCSTKYNSTIIQGLTCSWKYHFACIVTEIFYKCIINGLLPLLLMVTFGLLTCRNVRNIRQRSITKSNGLQQLNEQLTTMFLLQTFKSGFSTLPYVIWNCYLIATANLQKSLIRHARERLANQIVCLLFWSELNTNENVLKFQEIFEQNLILSHLKYTINKIHEYKKQYIEFTHTTILRSTYTNYIDELFENEYQYPLLNFFNTTS